MNSNDLFDFPLVRLELERATRRQMFTRLRMALPVLAAVCVGLVCVFAMLSDSTTRVYGGAAQNLMSYLSQISQFAIVFVFTPLISARVIAVERQEGTLGLLLLAQRGRWDLYFAKFLSVFLPCETLLLSVLPISSILSILGGASLEGLFAQFALLSALTLAICAVCVFISSMADRVVDAYFWSLFAVAVFIGAILAPLSYPSFVPWWPILSGFALEDAYALPASLTLLPRGLFESFVIFATASICTGFTIRVLPDGRRATRRRRQSARWLVRDPIARLYGAALQGFTGPWFQFPRILFPIAMFCVIGALSPAAVVTLPLLPIYLITSSVWSARRNGWLEPLVLSDATGAQLAPAMLRVHARRTIAIMIAPLVTVGIAVSYGEWKNVTFGVGPIDTIDFCYIALLSLASIPIAIATALECAALGCYASTWPGNSILQTVASVLLLLIIDGVALLSLGCFAGIIVGVVLETANASQTLVGEAMVLIIVGVLFAAGIVLAYIWRWFFLSAFERRWRWGFFTTQSRPVGFR